MRMRYHRRERAGPESIEIVLEPDILLLSTKRIVRF